MMYKFPEITKPNQVFFVDSFVEVFSDERGYYNLKVKREPCKVITLEFATVLFFNFSHKLNRKLKRYKLWKDSNYLLTKFGCKYPTYFFVKKDLAA